MRTKQVAALGAAVAALAGAGAAHAETVEPIATGLDNPRQVSLAADGTLYVALTGRGGSKCAGSGETRQCVGRTGRIVSIKNGTVATHSGPFASLSGSGGMFAAGVHGVSVAPDGDLFAVTASAPPQVVRKFPKSVRREAGRLFEVTARKPDSLFRVDRLEWRNNFDGLRGDINSNPYAVLAENDRVLVVDAGANAVYQYRNGKARLFSVIPRNGRGQAVPSSIARGPDGAIYVGELAETAGKAKARVHRIPARGGKARVHARGFTNIAGLAFGPDGSMFVTELGLADALRGAVIRVAPDGTRTTLGAGKLIAPQGAAVDASGAIYVSTGSVFPRSTPADGPFGGASGGVAKITP